MIPKHINNKSYYIKIHLYGSKDKLSTTLEKGYIAKDVMYRLEI